MIEIRVAFNGIYDEVEYDRDNSKHSDDVFKQANPKKSDFCEIKKITELF